MNNRSLETAVAARLAKTGPIRVAMIGAGACARMIAGHLFSGCPHVRLVGIANRTVERACNLLKEVGEKEPASISNERELQNAIASGRTAVTADAELLAISTSVEVIVEVTGTVEFGARVVLKAIEHGKHVVLVNAELDSTLGPVLKHRADQAGVVITHTDGEEPGVAMTLLRYLSSIGLRPVAAGNLKGMIDRYRTPQTQREFAARHAMDPAKVASFADGTKLCMESTILANATGFKVGKRGMYGPACAHVKEIAARLPAEQLLDGGLIDYALGAEPGTGAFVVVHEDRPAKRKELEYFKMGAGPFYVFYTPYHLPQLQIASTIARAVLMGDATVTPAGPPVTEVIAVGKRDLQPGHVLDGVGGSDCYGTIENASVANAHSLLPIGIAGGCRLLRGVRKDEAVSYADVELPAGRLIDQLRAEQQNRFG